jgi:SNF2 family DNA or RNA helicase
MKKNMLAWIGEHEREPIAAPTVMAQLVRLQQFTVASVDVVGPVKVRKRSKDYNVDHVAKFLRVHPDLVDHHLKCYPNLAETLPHDRRYRKWYEVEVYKYVLTDPSTKIDTAMDLVEDSNEPLVFFSHFKTLINLFGKHLAKAGISHGLLTGDTTQDDRGQLVRDFQAGKLHVLAGTIAAGGEGITLTRSSHVVFFDRSWSPSKNRQAEDRLHRIGQKNAVQVTDIMARSTIDLGRVQQIQQKWTWLQTILGDKTFDYQQESLRVNALVGG